MRLASLLIIFLVSMPVLACVLGHSRILTLEETRQLIAVINSVYRVHLSPKDYMPTRAREMGVDVYRIEVLFPTGAELDGAKVYREQFCTMNKGHIKCVPYDGYKFRMVVYPGGAEPIRIGNMPVSEAEKVLTDFQHLRSTADSDPTLNKRQKAEISRTKPKYFQSLRRDPRDSRQYTISYRPGLCGSSASINLRRVQCGKESCPLKWVGREVTFVP